jgi:hypothetical protein
LVPPPTSFVEDEVAPTVALDMTPVHVPAMADRGELVVRQRNGGTAILEGEQWVSPLQEELYSAVSLELARQVGAVLPKPPPAVAQRIKVRVDVRRFEGELGRYALIEAQWRVSLKSQGVALELSCQSIHVQAAPGDVEQLVAAYRRSAAALGDDIASFVVRFVTTADAHCGV